MTGPAQPRVPVEPLLAYALRRFPVEGVTGLSDACGVSRSALQRWRREGGIPLHSADRAACGLGEHPCYFWPEWFSWPG